MVEFVYMDKVCNCDIYIDGAPDPCYIFIVLLDSELIGTFGEELIIKTDFEKLMLLHNDHEKVKALKQAVFEAIQSLPEFTEAKMRLKQYAMERE